MYLLDINVLIALADPQHIHHARTRRWFLTDSRRPWATCPLTENGFIRILGQPSYPDFSGGTDGARAILDQMCLAPGHQFWPDAISLRNTVKGGSLPGSKHLTDLYLLALAIHGHGRLATLDARLNPALLTGGEAAYFVIPQGNR